MKKNHLFFVVFTALSSAILLLVYSSFHLIHHNPDLTKIFFIQCLNPLVCYLLLGSLGLPLVLLASIFGWVQLILLLKGNIHPHLGSEGFFNVLETLFSKI